LLVSKGVDRLLSVRAEDRLVREAQVVDLPLDNLQVDQLVLCHDDLFDAEGPGAGRASYEV
jgi:hypothetical protein